MEKPFIALYKAFRGGEWFKASLESVREHTDGAVVVFSDAPWLHGLRLPCNCDAPLDDFCADHREYKVVTRYGTWRRQEDQYNEGLEAIRETWGEEAAVLVIDTDEIWEADMLRRLKEEVGRRPNAHYFTSRIWSYLRSPLYVAWPVETPHVLVALQNCREPCVQGRFQYGAGQTVELPDIDFHHFTYVRENEADITEKFLNTSSQEKVTSDAAWLDTVWKDLPRGHNLHMTPGCEAVWGEIKIVTPRGLPRHAQGLPFVNDLVYTEDVRWRDRIRVTPPTSCLIPMPTWDKRRYEGDLRLYLGDVDLSLIMKRLQTSCLESLWLAHWASEVPPGGRIVEIGCGHGATTTCLAAASAPSVSVCAVDPFEPYDEQALTLVRNVMEGDLADFWDTLGHYRVDHKVEHIAKTSSAARLLLERDLYDMVFVDANHSYEHVKHDLAMMWPLVKPGGILVGHDYTTRFPGVIRAADEFPVEFAVAAGTSLFYARKPANDS